VAGSNGWPQVRLVPAILIALAMSVLALTGCVRESAPTRPPEMIAVPQEVTERLSGRVLVAVVATSTGPYSVGLGVVGHTSGSVGATFSAVTWVSTDSTQTRLLEGGKSWEVVKVLVRRQDGLLVFGNSQSKALIRGGRPVLEPLGGGHVLQNDATFPVDSAGTYRVYGVASFGIRRLEATGTVRTSDQFDSYFMTTPSIDITVR
jgi:hypothetical protein